MLVIQNDTPFAARLLPWLDVDGVERAIVIVKATYAVDARGGLAVAAAQADVQLAAEPHGDPAKSSVRIASDVVPAKAGTDVAVVGSARAPRPEVKLDVELRVGPLRKALRVTGDRRWGRGPMGLRAS